MHMELQRTSSESIRTHFDECVKDAAHGFLMTSAEGENVSSLKDEPHEGETFKIHAAAQANLLELDTGGLDDDSWLVASPMEALEAAQSSGLFPSPPSPPSCSTEEQTTGFAARKRSASSPEPLAQSQALRQLHNRELGQSLSARPLAASPVALPAQQSSLASPARPGVSKIPCSPTAQSSNISKRQVQPGSPLRLPSPSAFSTPQRAPAGTKPLNRASPASESRIPKPRTTAATRSAARSLVEESVGSGSTGTEESTGRFRKRAGGGPKKPVEELENGWVGSGIELPTDNAELPAELAGEALALAARLSKPTDDDLKEATLHQGNEGETSLNSPMSSTQGALATNSSIALANNTRDATTQIMPKSRAARQHDQPKQGCTCCSVM